uniref:Uncharacterized protein n=1 Tax=Ananas comosus var. bracteatus TaxID=296719 RepID=A0A6V7PKI7_ANACO|nr:unnamed protein product [Ananas comosus var. bracteatus]
MGTCIKRILWRQCLETLKASIAILFRQSTLQEPAFKELILLYTDESTQSRARDEKNMLPLQLKIYEKIPIPDLQLFFLIEAVRLDIATIIGLLAYIVNYKFENIVSSPSAILLDVVAVSALINICLSCSVGLQTDLGQVSASVYFLLDASEQQQYKEAVLVYALLLHPKKYQVSCRKTIGDACDISCYGYTGEIGLVIEFPMDEDLNIVALSCSEACEILRKRWDSLLEQNS